MKIAISTHDPYNDIAEAWIKTANSERNAHRLGVLDAWMLAAVGDPAGLSVIDLGCGELSTFLNSFLQAGFTLTSLQEPKLTPEQCARYPEVEDLLRVPLFAIYQFEKT